eukprot:2917-Pleurochrysis_carterae.AAC.5
MLARALLGSGLPPGERVACGLPPCKVAWRRRRAVRCRRRRAAAPASSRRAVPARGQPRAAACAVRCSCEVATRRRGRRSRKAAAGHRQSLRRDEACSRKGGCRALEAQLLRKCAGKGRVWQCGVAEQRRSSHLGQVGEHAGTTKAKGGCSPHSCWLSSSAMKLRICGK